MKITEDFNLEEFECNCGCDMPEFVKKNIIELAENLQILRNVVGRLDLTNAYRCKEHNYKVGGSKYSQHLKGKAADIKSETFDPSEIGFITNNLMKIDLFDLGGIGLYKTFTHVDIRGTIARWNNTDKK